MKKISLLLVVMLFGILLTSCEADLTSNEELYETEFATDPDDDGTVETTDPDDDGEG